MTAINTALQIDGGIAFVIWFFAILFAAKEIIEIFSYFKKKFGIKTSKEEDRETIEERIATLEKHDKWQYSEIIKIANGIDDIRGKLLSNEIETKRWEILDFASSLSAGRIFSKEQFQHVIATHGEYEKLIAENGLKNGLVTSSMEVIEEKYKEYLKNGIN